MGPTVGAKITFLWDDLISITDDFSDQNLIGKTENFKVFRGKISASNKSEDEDVTVKIWDDNIHLQEKLQRLKVERRLLANPSVIKCPNIAKLIDYCCEDEHVAAVYKLNPVAILEHVFEEDNFEWRDRVVAALGIARLFMFLQSSEMHHLIPAVQPPNIILDQRTNPILYDFGFSNDEIIQLVEGAGDVLAGHVCSSCEDGWPKADAVLSFDIMLLRLMRRNYEVTDSPEKPIRIKETCRLLYAYQRLHDQGFYYECDYFRINRLVYNCIDNEKKPTISEVVQTLENLLLFSLPVSKTCENVVVNGCELVYFPFEDLRDITEGLSKENLFAKVHLGKAYRGKIQQGWKNMDAQDVIIKIWGRCKFDPCIRSFMFSDLDNDLVDNICRLRDEVFLLTNQWMINHPNTAKLLGYCFDGKYVGAVYRLKPFDTLQNLFDNNKLKWKDRINVALNLAHLLELLHGKEPQYLIGNMSAVHIAIDQEKNPVLYDFSMLKGPAVLPGRTVACNSTLTGVPGYVDPFFIYTGGLRFPHSDVFAFGVLLMSLICKCDMAKEIRNFIYRDVEEEYKSKFSHAHESFRIHPSFDQYDAHKLSVLAMECFGMDCLRTRPKATAIVERLSSLYVISGSLMPTTGNNVEAMILKPDFNKRIGSWKKYFVAFKRPSLIASDKQKKARPFWRKLASKSSSFAASDKETEGQGRCVSFSKVAKDLDMLERLQLPRSQNRESEY